MPVESDNDCILPEVTFKIRGTFIYSPSFNMVAFKILNYIKQLIKEASQKKITAKTKNTNLA